jgi:hypothetical protein
MKSAWEWLGYKDGLHYVVCKKPLDWYERPYQQPERFENVITWWNGATVILGSMDRPQLLRGGNNDWVICDEALLIDKQKYDQVVSTSVRGSHPALKGLPGHLNTEFTSSMPYGTLGKWLLEMEVLSKNPDNDIAYNECTSWHNRVVLGDDVLKKWKRELNPTSYAIEVMNQRIRQFGAMFYPGLSAKHWYQDSFNYKHIDSASTTIQDCRWDGDRVDDMPLYISHDWGAFNSITIDQYLTNNNEVRFLNVMHVTHPLILDDLANEFCRYYQYHSNKTVYQYGDKSGAKREGNAKLSNFEQFATILRKQGWTVIKRKIGDVGHLERHNFIIRLHKENDARLPRIRHNANRCNDLRIALESAPMRDDKKDKRSENNANVKPQHATHLTDAYDYRLYHAFSHIVMKPLYSSEVGFSK